MKKNQDGLWLALGIFTYIVVFTCLTMMRHLSSALGDPDVSIFNQAFYTALKYGLPFYNTFEGSSHFAFHCSPIFYLLLPLYAIAPGVPILLFLQSLALGLGAWPIFLIAREVLSSRGADGGAENDDENGWRRRVPLFLALIYLLYHPLHGINYDQFNELSFAVLPLSLAVYFFLRRRMLPFWICSLIFITCKEDAAFVLIFWGLYILFLSFTSERSLKFGLHGLALVLLGTFYIYGYLYVFLPSFAGKNYGYFGERYTGLGSSLLEVVKTILTRPLLVLGMIATKTNFLYFFEMFLPLALIPLLSPGFLWMTIPTFGINMLSKFSSMCNTGSRYTAYLIPFIFTAAAFSFLKLVSGREDVFFKPYNLMLRSAPGASGRAARLLRIILLMAVLCTLLLNNTPLRIGFRVPGITPHQRLVMELAGKLPPEASVSTQVDILAHVSSRLDAWSGYAQASDFIFVDESSRWFRMHARWDSLLPGILARGWYLKIYDREGIRLYVNRCSKYREFRP
jgi:uncharacterized membrane protein